MDQFTKEGRKLRPRKTAQSTVSAGKVEYRSENQGYGERRQHTEGKPYGERRSYGEGRPQGERRQYGEHRQYSNNGEHRSYSSSGERRPYGNSGENRQYDRRERRQGPGYGRPSQDERFQRPAKNAGAYTGMPKTVILALTRDVPNGKSAGNLQKTRCRG